MSDRAIETKGICKAFPGVLALSDVSVQVKSGSCHALMGENGAGKSTLGKVICGLIQPDSGELLLDGQPVHFAGPQQAIKAGVSIVHQELVFCENLSVAENLCLDDLPRRGIFLDRGEMRKRAVEWLKAIEADVNPDQRLGELPISKQQLVQIAGAVGRGAKVLIFDEPTSSLSQKESQVLFQQIRQLLTRGVTCIYVSHRMDEIFELCDTVTVLRDGKVVGTKPVTELDRESLVRMMIGRDIEVPTVLSSHLTAGAELLKVSHLSSPGKFEDISFSVRAGEIVGLAGLVGAGRTEIAEALFGLDSLATGVVELNGAPSAHKNPAMAMKAGLGLVPEDRKRQGLVLGMNARENISLPVLKQLAKLGFVEGKKERELARRFFDRLRVKAPSLDSPTLGLSGGNQQKLVIAKWLAANCDVLILDEPTRGVDVGAKAEIHSLIRQLASEGKAVLVITSELPELLILATRILAIRNGRISGELPAQGATEESVMRLMTGVVAAAV